MSLTPALRAALFSLVMILCASGTNAVMDTLTVGRYPQSIFTALPDEAQQWWNPRISYENKWRNGVEAQGEAFPLSSTAFVFVTDGWHFFKFFTVLFIYLAVIAPLTLLIRLRWYYWILIYLALDLVRGGVFEIVYALLRTR